VFAFEQLLVRFAPPMITVGWSIMFTAATLIPVFARLFLITVKLLMEADILFVDSTGIRILALGHLKPTRFHPILGSPALGVH